MRIKDQWRSVLKKWYKRSKGDKRAMLRNQCAFCINNICPMCPLQQYGAGGGCWDTPHTRYVSYILVLAQRHNIKEDRRNQMLRKMWDRLSKSEHKKLRRLAHVEYAYLRSCAIKDGYADVVQEVENES